jgi:hypothetical protein
MSREKGEPVKKIILILLVPVVVACGAKQQTAVQAQTKPAVTQAAALPPGHPAVETVAAAPAMQQPAPAAAASNVLSGKVAETMNAGGYTYIRIGNQWAAVPAVNVKKGDNVTISAQMVMENFESKSLNRKFDKIVFGSIANGAAPVPAAAPAQPAANPMASAMGTPSQHMNPAVDAGPIKVEKAANGHTVAEVWEMKGVMRDQPVTVRGKVVKFLPEIMGKNWLHVRDGSGTRAKGDDDITVTTKDAVKVGDVITVTGTLRVDKDFGAGYMYPVIIEDAKVSH